MRTKIYGATLLTCAGRRIENGYILFDENAIIELGNGVGPDADEVIDAHGGFVVPGFIDAHSHLGMMGDSVGFESDEVNEITDPVTPQLRATDALNPFDRYFEEALEGGVTTVATGPGSANGIGGQIALVHTYGKRIEDMVVKAPLAMKMALGENPKVCYHGLSKSPETRMATAAIIRTALEKARRYKKKLDDGKDVAFDEKSDALIPLLERKIQAHIHCHRADDIFTAIRLSKEFDLDYVIVHCTEGHLIAPYLAQEGVKALSGPFITDRSKPELRNLTVASPGILAKAGIETAIVTDSPVIPQQYLNVCAAIAVREGMDEDKALCGITSVPAKILGVDGMIGSLEVGKHADLSLFNLHPFDFRAKAQNVFIGGVKRV